MTKRTVNLALNVTAAFVIDPDVLLATLRGGDVEHPWVAHLLSIYETEGVDALVQAYAAQSVTGGLNTTLRKHKAHGCVEDHGGSLRFAPVRATTTLRPRKFLTADKVRQHSLYRFHPEVLRDHPQLWDGVFQRMGGPTTRAVPGTSLRYDDAICDTVIGFYGHEKYEVVLV